MSPKQKRILNRARKAMLDLCEAGINDDVVANQAIDLCCRTAGSLIGGGCAAHGQSPETASQAAEAAAKRLLHISGATYATYLRREKEAGRAVH